jgi:hypothetical protein
VADFTSLVQSPGTPEVKGAGINIPDIDKETLEVRNPAILDGAQAWSVYVSLETSNRNRTSVNSELDARYFGKQPHDAEALRSANQGWRSNFPTLTLAGRVDEVVGRLVSVVDNLRTLTNSKLRYGNEKVKADMEEKTRKFQDGVTQTIRRWRGWRALVTSICKEVALIGYACPASIDQYEWRPRFYRSDQAFIAEGSAQYPESVQTVGFKQSVLIHEQFDYISKIRDKDGDVKFSESIEVAEVAGWNWEAVVDALNMAMPKQPTRDANANAARVYQDMAREINLGMSYQTGSKVVDWAILLAQETDSGKVSKFIINRNQSHQTLFQRHSLFDSMADCIHPFCLEPGNLAYYGSKGLGRMLINITTAMDVAANDAVDSFRLSGLKTLIADAKGGINAQIRVTNPFVQVTTDAQLGEQNFTFNADAFVQLYSQLGNILQLAAGQYLPNQMSQIKPGKERTATEEMIDRQREVEAQQAFVARFLGQFYDMVFAMQKRLLDPDTPDEEAQKLRKMLLDEGLSKDEIEELRKTPTVESIQDLAQIAWQQISSLYMIYKGNPFVDQVKLLKKDIAARSSPQIADELVLPMGVDPTSQAENIRQQLMESAVMQLGDPINTSPRDLDKAHLDVIEMQINQAMPGVMAKVQGLQRDPNGVTELDGIVRNLQLVEAHAQQHLQSWEMKGGKESMPQIAPYQAKMQQFTNTLRQGAAELQRFKTKIASAMQQQQQQMMSGQLPPGVTSQMMAGAPQGMSPHMLKITSSLDYKSAPDDIKRQIEAAAGLVPSKVGEVAAVSPSRAPQPAAPPIGLTVPTPTPAPASTPTPVPA